MKRIRVEIATVSYFPMDEDGSIQRRLVGDPIALEVEAVNEREARERVRAALQKLVDGA